MKKTSLVYLCLLFMIGFGCSTPKTQTRAEQRNEKERDNRQANEQVDSANEFWKKLDK